MAKKMRTGGTTLKEYRATRATRPARATRRDARRTLSTKPAVVVPEDLRGIRYVLAEIVKRLGQLERKMFG